MLQDLRNNNQTFKDDLPNIQWTGYIDAVRLKWDGGNNTSGEKPPHAEHRMPAGTKHHFNRYQSVALVGIPGIDVEPTGARTDNPTNINLDELNTDGNPGIWPRRTGLGNNALDHTMTPFKKGISEDDKVQEQLIASLRKALPNGH